MKKTFALFLRFFIILIFISCPSQPVEEDEKEKEYDNTFNPVLDFFINRTWNTVTNTLLGYGIDGAGTMTDGQTGSEVTNSGGTDYHNFFKLLYNFNISSLNGASIKSAYFRVYLYNITSTVTPENARLENIFYGNTDSFPNPRNYDNEFGGYIITPAITGTMDVTTIGWRFIDVKSKLQADINAGRTNSQFRLTNENENSYINAYYCSWRMTDYATNIPELVVTYTK